MLTLSTLIGYAQDIITEMGSAFSSLNASFGIFLFIPVILTLTRAMISLVKGILMFRRGRRR